MMAKIAVLVTVMVLLASFSYGADCNNGGRYEDNGNGTVSDCRTGVVWLKNANCTQTINGIDKSSGYLNWNDAMTWVAGLQNGNCGLGDGSSAGDWRLPTKTEWMAMVEYAKRQSMTPTLTNAAGTGVWTSGDPFTNVYTSGPSRTYWAITTTSYDAVAYINIVDGATSYSYKYLYGYVWPLRGGSAASFGYLVVE